MDRASPFPHRPRCSVTLPHMHMRERCVKGIREYDGGKKDDDMDGWMDG